MNKTWTSIEPTDQQYPAIYANAVFLHFDAEQFSQALANVRLSLLDSGVLCLGMKIGDFEGWRKQGLSSERYFKFWRVPALEDAISTSGFDLLNSQVSGDGSFVVVTARKSTD